MLSVISLDPLVSQSYHDLSSQKKKLSNPPVLFSTALRSKALRRLHDHRTEPPSSHGGRWCGWSVAAARWDPPPGWSTRTGQIGPLRIVVIVSGF